MTAYQLRRHLAAAHDVRVVGADYGLLLSLHDAEHESACNHDHEEGE